LKYPSLLHELVTLVINPERFDDWYNKPLFEGKSARQFIEDTPLTEFQGAVRSVHGVFDNALKFVDIPAHLGFDNVYADCVMWRQARMQCG
jgi:hypothetical protein